jgi:putative inorganic carbon (hco3(-)) transporter
MRDLLIFVLFTAAIPKCILNPLYGLMLWVVVSVMNPHRLTYGMAYDFPFALLAAIVVFVSLVMSKQKKTGDWDAVRILICVLAGWICVTQITSINFDESIAKFSETLKMLIMVVAAFFIVKTRRDLSVLLACLVVSIGFYGFKGGIFTIFSGGENRVLGPPMSQVGDNNEISIALAICLPLGVYVYHESKNLYVRLALALAGMLSFIAILGSHSRGALIVVLFTGLILLFKSNKKILGGIAVVFGGILGLLLMPEKWFDRMSTISSYQDDLSVQGRFNGWMFAYNLAIDNPIFGGGFSIYTPSLFWKYAPIPEDLHTTHNIFFQYLGEHGFVGVGIFLSIVAAALVQTWRVTRMTRGLDDWKWANRMGHMLQVSILAFLAGGMNVNIGYWDFVFYLFVCASALHTIVRSELKDVSVANVSDLSTPVGRRYSRG